MATDLENRKALHQDLASLAQRYIDHHDGRDLDGLTALGEDLLRLADRPEGSTSWMALMQQLRRISG